jgi:hypothetical protein
MRIKVSSIKPNPFRDIDRYPIDRDKVESLKAKIKKTFFWNNIVCRKVGAFYEIAYGHHRLIAIKECGIKEIDIPVVELSDAEMVLMMADENHKDWNTSAAVVLETVRATKKFIDDELSRYATLADLRRSKSYLISLLDRNITEGKYQDLKKNGCGQTLILKFLGDDWKQWHIQDALKILNLIEEGKVSEKAVNALPSMSHAKEFLGAVDDYDLDHKEQEKAVKEVVERQGGKRAVREEARRIRRNEETTDVELADAIFEIEGLLNKVDEQARALANKITDLNSRLEQMNVQQIKGLQAMFIKGSFADLLPQIKTLLKTLGVKGL